MDLIRWKNFIIYLPVESATLGTTTITPHTFHFSFRKSNGTGIEPKKTRVESRSWHKSKFGANLLPKSTQGLFFQSRHFFVYYKARNFLTAVPVTSRFPSDPFHLLPSSDIRPSDVRTNSTPSGSWLKSTIPARRRSERCWSGARAVGDFSTDSLWYSRWIMDSNISLSEPLSVQFEFAWYQ